MHVGPRTGFLHDRCGAPDMIRAAVSENQVFELIGERRSAKIAPKMPPLYLVSQKRSLRGHGGEELLESYGAERRPVIKQVIETTDLMTEAMASKYPSHGPRHRNRDLIGVSIGSVAWLGKQRATHTR